MIVTKLVYIKISRGNITHFLDYYKDIKLKDIIQVDIEFLQKNSNKKIDVSCDICGIERNIKYQSYIKNINSCESYKIYTCDKCSHIKIKKRNQERYGVDYYSQTDEYNTKFKKTMINRYGVEYSTQSPEILEKIKETNLERYGVDNIFKDNNYIRSKFKEKYGVDHPSKVTSIYKRIENTNLEKTGYKSPLSSPDIRNKIIETNNIRYGSNTPSQSDTLRDNLITSADGYLKYIGDNVSMFNCESEHIFYIDSSNFHNRNRSKIPLCTVCNPIGDSQSIKEKLLFEFIKSIYDGEIIQSYRDGLEIDIYLPELKIGFEFNGLYWHSDKYKDRNYHLNKTKYFNERDIRIIHIWEDEWDLKRDIIESQIKNWIGLTENKIFARKCEVSFINDKKISTKFLNDNHVQGVDRSIIKIGLYHKGELVSLMTFNKKEGRDNMMIDEWNLSRFCNILNTNIIGGSSKLLKFFINNKEPKRIISYANKDWSVGGLYYKLGFNNISESIPDYKYIIDGVRKNKQSFKKSNLKITNITESEYMKKSHIHRIWDCGKIKFEMKNI
jgi:hypothetical protein